MTPPLPCGTYTEQEVAERLGVSVRTVRRLKAAGKLPTIDLGLRVTRYPAVAIDRLVDGDGSEGP